MKPFVVADWQKELGEFMTLRISTGGAEYCVDWDSFRQKNAETIISQLVENKNGQSTEELLDALEVPKGFDCSLEPLFPEEK